MKFQQIFVTFGVILAGPCQNAVDGQNTMGILGISSVDFGPKITPNATKSELTLSVEVIIRSVKSKPL